MSVKSIFIILIMVASSLSGCIGGKQTIDDDGVIVPESIKIAFLIKDDYSNFDENPYRLADYLSQQIGKPVELYPITSDALALEALRFGSADMAFMDGGAGWVGWQKYGLQVAAADMNSDGKTYYQAHAWVLNGSDVADALQDGNESTDPFALLQGKTSCHTGWLKSAGMLIPMGYLIGNNYTEVIGDAEDIESLRNTIFNFFNEDASIPESGTPYYGYSGAMKCLSDGKGEVAFAKDSTVDTYCNNNDWCLDLADYIKLPAFGNAPSHPLMYQPNSISDSDRAAIVSALVKLQESEDGRSILQNILNTPGIVESTTELHLDSYSGLISHVPGISQYMEEKYQA
jgi:ABC-type phosphate/phosphonate transport system substrate-binding protein